MSPVNRVSRARLLAAATLIVVLASTLLAGAPASNAASARAPSTITWIPCDDGFQCATVEVPLDYDHPHGQQISLALIRLPAAVPSQRIGSLFMNPGGPGGSGVDFVRAIGKILPAELQARFDIVGFDPRGVSRSTPLRCFDTFEQALSVSVPFRFPVTPQEESVQKAADRGLADACEEHGGRILDHMSTANVARDLDRLRADVGDSRLNYLGLSYGSYLGVTYANLFPGKVRALVVDGVLDPIAWSTGRGQEARTQPFLTRVRSDEGAQRTLEEFFRLCDKAGAPACAFAGDSAQRFAALAKQLLAAPLEITDPVSGETVPVTYADLIAFTLDVLYVPVVWPEFAAFLADAVRQATPATLGRRLGQLRSGLGLDAAAQEEYPNFVEGGPGVACSDSDNPTSYAAWPRAADAADRDFGYFGRPWTWDSSICQPWPGADRDRYMGPFTARTAKPVLVVGNFFDPATRYQGAVTVSRLLPNSRLLSYAGWGHTAAAQSNVCIDTSVTRYLVTTRPPPVGTVCAPDASPFEPLRPAAARTSDQRAAAVVAGLLPEPARSALRG